MSVPKLSQDLASTAGQFLPLLVLVLACTWVGIWWLSERQPFFGKERSKEMIAGSKGRPPSALGDPDPLRDFDLSQAKTRDYLRVNKTIRYPYFQTMAHQPLHINDWLEVDKNYPNLLASRNDIIREGRRVVDSLPENHLAAGELLQLVVDYMPKRFPTLFETMGRVDGIRNKVTGEIFTACSTTTGSEALKVISRLAQGDFVMAQERADGRFYCTGGIVRQIGLLFAECRILLMQRNQVTSPGFYMLGDILNKSMQVLHDPVPDFNKKLLLSVERTFKRFKPEEPFERSSWTIVDDRNLLCHNIVNLPDGARLDGAPKDYMIRIDHQTFRKLPKTGAIVFGGHPVLIPLSDLADEPLIPALLKTVYETASQELLAYKRADMYQEQLVKYLESLTQSQIERGLIKGTENVAEFREYARASNK